MDNKFGRQSAATKARWKERARSFLTVRKDPKVKRPKRPPKLKDTYLANKYSMKALDNALQHGIGWGLSSFVAARPVVALKRSEKRYYVAVDTLPENSAVRSASKGRKRRSCIWNTESKSSKLEVHWGAPRRTLVSFLDMGTVGWSSKYWLYLRQHVRGSWMLDPSHRRWDNVQLNFADSGLGFIKSEAVVVNNVCSGPWQTQGNFGKLKDAAEEFFENASATDPLFMHCYPMIVRDLNGGRLPLDFGSEDHVEATWAGLRDLSMFETQGHHIKLNRWFSLIRRARISLKVYSVFCMILVYIGLHEGWYDSIEESPLVRGFASTCNGGGPAGDAGPGLVAEPSVPQDLPNPMSRSVKHSSAELDKVRDKCKSSMHLAGQILSNRTTRAVLAGICKLCEPVEEQHGKAIVMMKSPAGCLQWYGRMASGDGARHLAECWGACNNMDAMLDLGLASHAQGFAEPHFSLKVCDDITQALQDFCRCMVARELEFIRLFQDWVPNKFAALAYSDEAKGEALQWLCDLWKALCAAEKAAVVNADAWLQDFLQGLQWPMATWARELMVGLDEACFEAVPPDVLEEVQLAFSGPGGTKDVEDQFNAIRKLQRNQQAMKLGRLGIWHRSVHAGVLEEAGKPQVPVTSEDRAKATAECVHADMCDSRKNEFSMGEDALSDFMKGKGWPHPSSQNYLLIPYANTALLQCGGHYNRLKKDWLAQVLHPGSFVVPAAEADNFTEAYWILTSNHFGALAMTAKLRKDGDVQWFELVTTGSQWWQQLQVESLDDWREVHCTTMSAPTAMTQFGARAAPALASSMWLWMVGDVDPISVLEANVARGFKSVGVAVCSKLLTEVGARWTGRKPTLEAEVLHLLMSTICPHLSQAELQLCFEQRKAKHSSAFETDIIEENAALIDDIMQEDEQMDFEKAASGRRTATTRPAIPERSDSDGEAIPEPALPAPGLDGEATPEPAATCPDSEPVTRRLPVFKGNIPVSDARTFCPAAKGVSLSIHQGNVQWQVKYLQRKVRPKSRSCSWSCTAEGLSQLEALKVCLRWVWTIHGSMGGELCPWDLGEPYEWETFE